MILPKPAILCNALQFSDKRHFTQLIDAPELGSFSLEELATLELPFGMHIERGLFFTGIFPISAYAVAARAASPRLSTSSWTACWKRCGRSARVDIAEPDE
ncbi:MAG: DUF2958 domain-containing protein [Mesorhizobium sp.]|nr:MAG: DUF2958 domain-containing protein [Mesorhizobium sp.]